MDANARTVRKILHAGDQYVIPLFQRSYSWDKKHWKRLKEDVWTLMDDGIQSQHFLGPLVCTPCRSIPGEVPAYQLIDGQQRITTLTVMLAALRDVCIECDYIKLAKKIEDGYLVHSNEEGLQRYKVVPRLGDRAALISVIEGNASSESEQLSIIKAWSFFKKHIDMLEVTQGEEGLQRLFSAISAQLSLVVITIDGENPYEIFESLNSTGLPLEESDLIRNYVFMQVPLTDQEEFHDEHWKSFEGLFDETENYDAIPQTQFYRSYLMRNGVYAKGKSTFIGFKEQSRASERAPADLVAELKQFARYEILLRRPETCQDSRLRRRLTQLLGLDVATAHPLLIVLLDGHGCGEISTDTLLGCLDDLASFVIRRSICGETTRPYNRWFPEAIKAIKGDLRENLREYWLRRGWPDNDAFAARLLEFSLYRREPKKCRLILEALEQSFGHKEAVDLRSLTIEHVMPQTIKDTTHGRAWMSMLGEEWSAVHETWLHTLGNLTLSGYNPELSNRPFDYKRGELQRSKLSLNEYFETVDVWDADAIRARGQSLAVRVAAQWPRPAGGSPYVVPRRIIKRGTKRERAEKRRLFWTGLAEFLQNRQSTLRIPESTTGWILNFPLGRSGVALLATIEPKLLRIGVGLRFRGARGKSLFPDLVEEKENIESEMGGPAEWREGVGRKSSFIFYYLPDTDSYKTSNLQAQYEWMATNLEKLQDTFADRIKLSKNDRGDEGTLTERQRMKLEYWDGFRQVLLERDGPLRPRSPRPQHWTGFSFSGSQFGLHASFSIRKNRVAVGMSCFGGNAKENFDLIAKDKDAIETEIGSALDWERLPDKKESRIALRKREVNPMDNDCWPEQHRWLADTLETFHRVFLPRVNKLVVANHSDRDSC